jgi:hypothetical protein
MVECRRWLVLSRATFQRSVGLARDLYARVPIPPKFEWRQVSLELSTLVGLTRGTAAMTAVAASDHPYTYGQIGDSGPSLGYPTRSGGIGGE